MTALLDSEVGAIAALGALLQRSPEAACAALDAVGARAEDLETASLRPLWAVLEEHARRRQPADWLVVAERLRGKVKPETVQDVLHSDVLPGTEVARLEHLHETAARRRLVEAMRQVAGLAKSGASMAELDTALRGLPALVASKARVRSAIGDTARIVEEADAAWHAKQSPLLKTGWDEFDSVLRLTRNLHAIGAQPGVGKSATVAGLVRNWTSRGICCGVLAYEDDGLDLQRRILACEAGLDVAGVSGERLLDVEEHERLGQAHPLRADAERFLFIDDAHPRGSVADVCASLRQMRARGAQVAILDNVSCVRMDGGVERHLQLEEALLTLRETAIELRMPVIAIGHLKRRDGDDETAEPRMQDFAGAASWERFCRSMCGMWRSGGVKLKVLKQNLGISGVRFDVELAAQAATVTNVTRETLETAPPKTATKRAWRGAPDDGE